MLILSLEKQYAGFLIIICLSFPFICSTELNSIDCCSKYFLFKYQWKEKQKKNPANA